LYRFGRDPVGARRFIGYRSRRFTTLLTCHLLSLYSYIGRTDSNLFNQAADEIGIRGAREDVCEREKAPPRRARMHGNRLGFRA